MRWFAIAIVVGLVVVGAIAERDRAAADIEGSTFVSTDHNVRVTLPRGWRITDQATYPGVILRMFRTRPRGAVALAVDPLPATIAAGCETRPPAEGAPAGTEATILPIELQIACHQSKRLEELGFAIGTMKEAARPWFDYADGERRYLRQGVVVVDESVFTIVLAADTAAGRAQYARTFDKVLRSLRALTTEEAAKAAGDGPPPDAGVEGIPDAGVSAPP